MSSHFLNTSCRFTANGRYKNIPLIFYFMFIPRSESGVVLQSAGAVEAPAFVSDFHSSDNFAIISIISRYYRYYRDIMTKTPWIPLRISG
ncbi:hypothetical protein C1H46_020439 [Malus baccata]|uniref:Uncharacterized protein n=1 Tax=Malus baccata TaxID=106549 RepID=A0A540M5C4_MALBA|nr:hypothetical protein C1H46_020439 [Malus baccata]